MTFNYIVFHSLPVTFSQNCVKMKNLLSYDFEKGIIEYIHKIGTKSTDFFVKEEI